MNKNPKSLNQIAATFKSSLQPELPFDVPIEAVAEPEKPELEEAINAKTIEEYVRAGGKDSFVDQDGQVWFPADEDFLNLLGGSDPAAIGDVPPDWSDEDRHTLNQSIKKAAKDVPATLAKPSKRAVSIADAVSIIQPKVTTYAVYDLSAVQEDILTLLIYQLQDYMQNKATLIRPNLFGILSVELSPNDIPACDGNAKKLDKQLDGFRKKDFAFTWKASFSNSEEARAMFQTDNELLPVEIETTGSIIITKHRIVGTNRIIVELNPWAVPYLLYIGKEVGGTKYFKDIAIALKGKYVKRLYKMVMDWYPMADSANHEVPIEYLRTKFFLTAGYDNHKIRSIVEDTRQQLVNLGSPVTFTFDMITKNYIVGKTKNHFDTIVFHINGPKDKKAFEKAVNMKTIKACLLEVADKERATLCDPCAAQIVDDRNLYNFIINKFQYFSQKMVNKEITKEEYKSIMRSVIFKKTGVDLRSREHIANINRKARKRAVEKKK